MKTKPRQLSIEINSGSSLLKLLEELHQSGEKRTAESIFNNAYLRERKISATDIIEVNGMGNTSSDNTYWFNYIVTKPNMTEQAEPLPKPPIKKTIKVTISKAATPDRVKKAMECFISQEPFSHDGYWWSICAKDESDKAIIFTLKKPCKTLDEWELMYKPAPVIKADTICPEVKVVTNSYEYDELMELLNGQRPYFRKGFWWDVYSIDIDGNNTVFTLKNPKLEPKQPIKQEMQSLLNNKRKQTDIVYIAGAISGDVVANRHRFAAAKRNILASSDNVTVLNPAELPDGLTQTQYMSICLPMVMMSTSIFMLTGWEKSKGAVAEHALAEKLGIEINYQGQHDGKL